MIKWRKLTKEALAETKERFAADGYVMRWFAMAQEVILATLGPEWWKANCLTTSERADQFLCLPTDSEDHRYDFQHRIVRLGHMLYQLQDCAGYEDFVEGLKSRDLESTFFELHVAALLRDAGHSVNFVKESSRKGADYDLSVTIETTPVHVEAKSKRSGDALNAKSLRNKLKTARKQLPAEGPGIIFVGVPVEWTMQADAEKEIGSVLANFLRETGRVNHVILVWEQWLELSKGRGRVTRVRQYDNLQTRFPLPPSEIVKTLTGPISLDPANQQFRPSFW
jgi:hypothetical protein